MEWFDRLDMQRYLKPLVQRVREGGREGAMEGGSDGGREGAMEGGSERGME